jgi:predicted lysophospholipase L1 biosynthesis ABC-type transport system permease subunit
LPVEPGDQTALNILVRTAAAPQDLARAAVAAARAMDAETVPEVQLLSSAFRTRLEGAEYSAWAVSVLSFIAHLLACLGIAGVVAYAVSQRTKEIGIRMALGAQSSQVLSVVLRQFSRPVVAGLIAGLSGAAALSQVLRGRLYGISNFDPTTYAIAIAVFLVTVTAAAILPARRALRIDPLRALRHE